MSVLSWLLPSSFGAGALLFLACSGGGPDDASAPTVAVSDEGVPIYETSAGVRFVRTPDERFKALTGYPFEPHYVEVDGLRVHYIDEGPRDGEVILLLHGEPSWSYLYRKMIPVLASSGHRVIAMDHVGMGRSDKPIDLAIHTYEQHVAWVAQFIAAVGLRDITLFCQDWGSLIGLRVAGEQPEIFARIVVANGRMPLIPKGIRPFSRPDPVEIDPSLGDFASLLATFDPASPHPVNFQKWINYALQTPDLTPSQVVEALTVRELTSEERAGYDAPYPSLIYKSAIRAFPSMVVTIQNDAVSDRTFAAWDALGRYDRPFLSLAGEHDNNLGSQAVQDELIQHVPGAAGQPHDRFDAHHFIQEDIGETLAQRVNAFISATPQ